MGTDNQFINQFQNSMINKRFANMPLNAFITVVGQVKRRPNNLKNFVSFNKKLHLNLAHNKIDESFFTVDSYR